MHSHGVYLTSFRELLGKSETITYTIMEFAMQANVHIIGVEAIYRRRENLDQHLNRKLSEAGIPMEDTDPTEIAQTIYDCAMRYDSGNSFGGIFVSAPTQAEAFEEYARRHMQLLSQLALSQPKLLLFLFDLYAVSVFASTDAPTKTECIKRIIIDEVANVVPVLMQFMTAEEILALIGDSDSLSVDLMIDVLGLLFRDERIPPSITIIEKVKKLAKELDTFRKRKALASIIGGLSADEVEELLTDFLLGLNSGTHSQEEIERILLRIHRARPPPLSKTALLVFLHR